MGKLDGQCAVIAGGNSGIGAASAELFAREGAAGLVILDRQKPGVDFDALAAALESKYKLRSAAFQCDFTDREQVAGAFQKAVELLGRIDILVNSIDAPDGNMSVLNTTDQLWDQVVAVNQNSVFHCCRQGLKQMEKQGQGCIVNLASAAGVSAASGAAYSAAKHAVVGLSRNIAIQYTGTGIRCNAILPGPTGEGGGKPEIYGAADGPSLADGTDEEFAEIAGRHTDRGIGLIGCEDHARVVLFFASEDSRAVNGQWILADIGAYG